VGPIMRTGVRLKMKTTTMRNLRMIYDGEEYSDGEEL